MNSATTKCYSYGHTLARHGALPIALCAVDGPSEWMLTDGGSVAITTLPSLPVFCTTGAEAGTDPVLVMVRSPPVLSPPVSEIVRSDEPVGGATRVIRVSVPSNVAAKVPLDEPMPVSVRVRPPPSDRVPVRSEERRVGKGCVMTSRFRW